ncbi:hypothetical protein WAF17_09485 [Bernardetia sp. ABR2-2B]|uniref:hypothetical protein n=1 Tax=Bernardetia sp. ABR2-2B TaxID=3127472 RepID=UPI0030D1BB29
MSKTDKSKHGICIAAIRKHTIKPYNFRWTKFYVCNSDFPYDEIQLELQENELLICSTVLDSENHSILTTQRLITKENGVEKIGSMNEVSDESYGNFKGYGDVEIIFGLVRLTNELELKYFIETGKASMIMVHGIRTLIRTQILTKKNIENLTRIWNRQNQNNEE